MCQRPERASFISTKMLETSKRVLAAMCQRPERASFISTYLPKPAGVSYDLCQRPERASFISTGFSSSFLTMNLFCVNALNGLLSFLPGETFQIGLMGRSVSTP